MKLYFPLSLPRAAIFHGSSIGHACSCRASSSAPLQSRGTTPRCPDMAIQRGSATRRGRESGVSEQWWNTCNRPTSSRWFWHIHMSSIQCIWGVWGSCRGQSSQWVVKCKSLNNYYCYFCINIRHVACPLNMQCIQILVSIPLFLAHPINVSVSLLIGGSTQLTCAPHINTGSPVVWYQNGNLVLPSFKMLSSGRFLWLFGVSADEEGDYTCSTTSGSVIETHYVDVLSK